MLARSLPRWLLATCVTFVINLSYPAVAFGQEAASAESAPVTSAPEQKGRFISDGTAVQIPELGITMTPPMNWEVITDAASISLIMQEQRREKPDYKNTSYQRNITVAAMHRSSPIDEKRAEELKAQMTATFAKDSLVADFQIIEHRFFNYRGENDGLLIYSSLKISDYPMMQMHILVSGEEKQFLLSYTDLAERFTQEGNSNFEQAWQAMTSIQVTGETPMRRDEYIRYGVLAGSVALILIAFLLVSRKRNRYDYLSDVEEGDSDYTTGSTSMIATLNGAWRIRDEEHDRSEPNIGLDFEDDEVAPRTKQTRYVSTY